MKVLILFGGNSSEHDISIKSAKTILQNIDYKKFKVTSAIISKKNNWYIYKDDIDLLDKYYMKRNIIKIDNIVLFLKQFDVIFPIIHGKNGEDGTLQGLFQLFDFKFVGSKTLASAVGMDKEFAKILFKHLNIPQIEYVSFIKKYDLKEIETKLGYPVIVKPANSGSSIGINKAVNQKELIKAIKESLKYDEKIIVEKFIKARELEVAIRAGKNIIVSDIGEIKTDHSFYDYQAKYEKKSTTQLAILDENEKKQIKDYALKAFIGINAKNIARVDFLYDLETKQIYLNEINTLPGFTSISMYPKLLTNETFTLKDLITYLILSA